MTAEGMRIDVKRALDVFKATKKVQRRRAKIKAIPMNLVKKLVNKTTLNETIVKIIK